MTPATLTSRHGRGLDPVPDPWYASSLPAPSALRAAKVPSSEKPHVSFLAGIRVLEPGRDPDRYSGYQVMRLATELVPTFAAILGMVDIE